MTAGDQASTGAEDFAHERDRSYFEKRRCCEAAAGLQGDSDRADHETGGIDDGVVGVHDKTGRKQDRGDRVHDGADRADDERDFADDETDWVVPQLDCAVRGADGDVWRAD